VVTEQRPSDAEFDVECPHCHRRFQAKVLSPRSSRNAGFKCPHCRLFVAFDRGAESTGTAR
jgi:transposase-like protein